MNFKALYVILTLLVVVWGSCTQPEAKTAVTAAGETTDEGFELEAVAGSDIFHAVKRNEKGQIIEEGFLLNNLRTGLWQKHRPDGFFPEEMISYANGLRNGPYYEISTIGQAELRANYRNNILHGPWAKYRFGRPEAEANYVDGKLDGPFREYHINDGKIKKEVNYKNGVLDGWMRYYDQEGKVTLQYEYKDGERVSGGMSTQPDTPAGEE